MLVLGQETYFIKKLQVRLKEFMDLVAELKEENHHVVQHYCTSYGKHCPCIYFRCIRLSSQLIEDPQKLSK